mgnify:CR=1 FL=1|tara:strand:- start:862 stop:1590 length:729 start_codon:yes stop_codon:yes gene_type:complete
MHHSDRKKKNGWQGYGDETGSYPFLKSPNARRWWNTEDYKNMAFDSYSRDYGKVETGASALKRIFGSQGIMNDIDTAIRSISSYDDVKELVDACMSTQNVFNHPPNDVEPLKSKVAVSMRYLSLTVLRVNPSAWGWLVQCVLEKRQTKMSQYSLSDLGIAVVQQIRYRINILFGPKIEAEDYFFIQDVPIMVLFELNMLGSYMTENIMAICLKRLDMTPAMYLPHAKNDYERSACLEVMGKC